MQFADNRVMDSLLFFCKLIFRDGRKHRDTMPLAYRLSEYFSPEAHTRRNGMRVVSC